MTTIANKLQRVMDAKADIKMAIEGKGRDLTDKTFEHDWADEITAIETGTDLSDADAAVGDVLTGKTFYSVEEPRKTGTMPNRGDASTDITTKAQAVTIQEGYHNGDGTVKISSGEQAKIIAGNIKAGITLLGQAGDSNVVDTTDANAAAGDILETKSGYVAGSKVTGTMPDRGTVSTDISAKATEVTIAAGKHSGSGVVKIATAEQDKIIAANIKKDIVVLGVTGNLASGTNPVIRYYTAGATWTKPAGLSHVLVVCIGGGGGGASGARQAAGVLARGGGGASSALPMRRTLTAAQLGETETIVVGAGGAGGAAQTTDDSANVAGSAGGDTSFGTLVLSQGALGGQNDGNGGAARVITNQTPPQEAHSIHRSGLYVGINSTVSGSTGFPPNNFFMKDLSGSCGGAAGGGLTTANAQSNGGAGGRAFNAADIQSAVVALGTAGGGDGADGHANYCDQLLLSYGGFVTTHGYGTSGAGGGSANAAAGGRGGHGGNYGAGGGGGGASRNGYASGAGGNGGDGLCIVMEFYGA
jgi:hypothetical protein